MSWETILAIVGALGGLEGVKYLLSRPSSRRIERAEAQLSELHVLQETMQFLQEQLRQQTQEARQLQGEIFEAVEKRHAAELELASKRCDRLECRHRLPPNIYTPTGREEG